ncbi:1-acyl-sn-glycerol-3-phosphate acyltransferase [Treponema sp. OttesenSCG-928-L16]|nr:1-acyl-sn-glycerol-3-phosphate acyltransferase [Treponema sp. OttesenSCG-928-L16]
MTALKTFLIFFFLVLALLILFPFGVLAFILSFLGMRKPMTLIIYKLAQGWAVFMIKLTGCQMTISGRENIPMKEGICVVSNHSGYFDIILALAYIGRPFGFIAKKELMLVPFINIWIWLLGGHFIDRKNLRKALHTINAGARQIRDGGAMIIFPEGTRSKGQGLLPFRSGAFKLATIEGAKIVPMAISGSYEAFEETGRVRSVPVRVSFGEPIATAGLSIEQRKKQLADQVHGVIGKLLS